ncbi:MAG: sigma-70 family RNA polymerase sigma factor [Planctomycetota bacterium]|nr:sigma-70 family RNA polymerase sigma factor [Planctomycetota bacterium]
MKQVSTAYQSNAVRDRRQALILEHLTFVKHILGKMIASLPKSVDRENLEAAGVLGLVEAAQSFDPLRGVGFKTFAYQRIRGAIYDELRRNCPIPQSLLQKIARLNRILQEFQGPCTPEILAEQSGFSAESVEQCLEAMRMMRPSAWDDLKSKAKFAESNRPDNLVEYKELRERLVAGIFSLPEQERIVISLYYLEDLRLKEIGEALRLSESRVSKILAKAEFRLQQSI